jgi:hypothetical protein
MTSPPPKPFSPFPLVGDEDLPPPTVTDLLGPIPPEISDATNYHLPAITAPRSFTSRHMAEQVWRAHEAIGGSSHLILWAARNPTKFYTTLFARMLPQGHSPELQSREPVTFSFRVPVKTIDIVTVDEKGVITPAADPAALSRFDVQRKSEE